MAAYDNYRQYTPNQQYQTSTPANYVPQQSNYFLPKCDCGGQVVEKVSNTPANPNRPFYNCLGCTSFMWKDLLKNGKNLQDKNKKTMMRQTPTPPQQHYPLPSQQQQHYPTMPYPQATLSHSNEFSTNVEAANKLTEIYSLLTKIHSEQLETNARLDRLLSSAEHVEGADERMNPDDQ
jgi:hypothetical protein